MPWWGWLIIGALTCGCIILAFIAIFKKKSPGGLSSEEVARLQSMSEKQAREESRIQRSIIKSLESLVMRRDQRIRGLLEALEEDLEGIDEERKKVYREYLDNPDAAGDALDELLGISSAVSSRDDTESTTEEE